MVLNLDQIAMSSANTPVAVNIAKCQTTRHKRTLTVNSAWSQPRHRYHHIHGSSGSTHVRVERRPVGDAAAEVPHDADDDDAGLQRGRPSLHTRKGHAALARGPSQYTKQKLRFQVPLVATECGKRSLPHTQALVATCSWELMFTLLL